MAQDGGNFIPRNEIATPVRLLCYHSMVGTGKFISMLTDLFVYFRSDEPLLTNIDTEGKTKQCDCMAT